MRLEKEKLEKEIKEIKEKKEKERLINEKLEKERIEKEKLIKQKEMIEKEELKKKKILLEKELREKLENEYKEKYEKEKLKKEEEQRKEKEKMEKLEKEKYETINREKKINLEKIKELEKKKEILEELEKEKKMMEEKRKNLSITSEVKNFIEGKIDNKNNDKLNTNFKFLPERLKTENENEFIMKGIDKKKYNYTITGNQQINIESNQINNNNIDKIINTNSNKYIKNNFNLNIEDIVSTRDIIFDTINNNSSEKIENLETENKNILHDLPLKINNSNILSKEQSKGPEINNIIEENDKSLRFAIENNNKNDIDFIKDKDKEKEKEDSLEMTNISNKEKEKGNNQSNINISDEENDNNIPETVLEFEENKKKINFNWKEKSKNRINEIIEEKQELEMIQSIDNTLKSNNNKNEFNFLPLPYNNYSEQPIIPVSEISTNNMRHISTYDQNIISSTRKFEPKELEDITGSLRIFTNRSENNNNLLSIINNKNNNNKPNSQRTNNNLNINNNNNNNLKTYFGNGAKKPNIPDINLLNESYKDTNPNDNIKDQKMKIDDLEQSKLLKESKNIGNKKNNNLKDDENKNIKLNKIIKLKSKEELNNLLQELKKLTDENKTLNDSLYFLLENDMAESNYQNSSLKNSQIIKVKNNKITTFDSDSRTLDNSFKKELFFNYNNNNNNNLNNNILKNNIFNNLNNLNNFNNMNNANNFNNIIINNDNNFNNINYINNPNDRLLNIKNNPHNNHTFKEIKNININKFLTEDKYERHTYLGQNHINIFNNNEYSTNLIDKNINMIKGIRIKAVHSKNKSHGKDKKHKKKTGIIEQVKKEQSEKKNNLMHNTFNNRNKNLIKNGNPYSNCKTQPYSKNSIAKIDYNNIYQYDLSINNINMNNNIMNEQNDFIHHKKSKSVNINKCLSCSPKKKYEDFEKYNCGQLENNNFFIYDNNNINNNNFIINKNNKYNEEEFQKIMNIKNKTEQENTSFILLRQKYLEFLIKIYGNNNIPLNKENEELDNIFLKGLVKNEVPIENINLNLLKCSNDMKNFICQSLENFKLQQLKEKIANMNNNKALYLNNNNDNNHLNKSNNLNGLIQLDYEDENKDKSNILEPIELEKSNFNINFRKSFIESLSGIKNDNIFYNSEILLMKKK